MKNAVKVVGFMIGCVLLITLVWMIKIEVGSGLENAFDMLMLH